MSRKRYPRLMRKKKAKHAGMYGSCEYPECAEKATHRCEVQESYMRGEDEFYRLCDSHTAALEKRCEGNL
jgi:hypothetical protein